MVAIVQSVSVGVSVGNLLGTCRNFCWRPVGVSVGNLGRPGAGATIIMRGAANLYGSQSPLVILDGVFVEGEDNMIEEII